MKTHPFIVPAAVSVLGLALAAAPARGRGPDVPARSRQVRAQHSAYAQVVPLTVLRLRAARAGVLTGLDLAPGSPVPPGTALARLAGPEVEAALARRRAAVQQGEARLEAAKKERAVDRRQLAHHLSTHQAVNRDQARVAEARAALHQARIRLKAVRQETTVRAATGGTVLDLKAANGERVAAGQTLLTVEPTHGLWLKAVYYGPAASAIHPGMTGHFVPADGGSALPVTVRGVVGTLRPDAGRTVNLRPAQGRTAHWHNGEYGTVTLQGPRHTAAAVPSRALILDKGRWWILVRTARGVSPRAVTPGSSENGWTVIERGLKPGTPVVVQDAYLRYHRRFARQYQPPD